MAQPEAGSGHRRLPVPLQHSHQWWVIELLQHNILTELHDLVRASGGLGNEMLVYGHFHIHLYNIHTSKKSPYIESTTVCTL